jgi:hypothetical protein
MIFSNLPAGWHNMLSHPIRDFTIGAIVVFVLILLGTNFVKYYLETVKAFWILDELGRDPGLSAQIQHLEKAAGFGRKWLGLSYADIGAMYAGEKRNGLTFQEMLRLGEELMKAGEFGHQKFGLSLKDIQAMMKGGKRNGLTMTELQRLLDEDERLRVKEG